MNRTWLVVAVVAVGLVVAGVVALVVVDGAASSVELELDGGPRSDLEPDLEVFCSFATKTGAWELLEELTSGTTDPSPRSTRDFAELIARRAPEAIHDDALVVARAADRVHPGRPPSAADRAAADRVDAYAEARCG